MTSKPIVFDPASGLPVLSEMKLELPLKTDRRTSYTADDLLRRGEQFAPTLPLANVTVGPAGAQFTPQLPQSGLSGLSLATYEFFVGDYSGVPRLQLSWNQIPADAQDVHVCLANWQTLRYDTFQLTEPSVLLLPAIAPYIRGDGLLLLCLMIGGSAGAELDTLRIGGLPPVVNVTATPAFGVHPVEISFNASASVDPDGNIAEYRWDTLSTGDFVSSGASPLFQQNYTQAVIPPGKLRVFDNDGIYTEAQLPVNIINNSRISYGGPGGNEQANQLLATDDGSILLFGRSGLDALFARIDPDLHGAENRLWGGATFDELTDAQLGQGEAFACGYTYSFNPDNDVEGLVQKWSLNGELLMSRSLSVPGLWLEFSGLVVTADSIYVCGRLNEPIGSRSFGIVARLDHEANVIWFKSLIAPLDCWFADIALQNGTPTLAPRLQLCGNYQSADGNYDALHASYGLDGTLLSARSWGQPGIIEQGLSVGMTGSSQLPAVFVSGQIGDSSIFVGRPGGATLELARPGGLTNSRLLRRDAGSVYMVLSSGAPDAEILLSSVQLDVSTDGVGTLLHSSGSCDAASVTPYGNSGLLIGGVQSGFLPSQDVGAFTSATSAVLWQTLSPAEGNPPAQLEETTLDTSIKADFALNRETADHDALIAIFANY